MSEGLNASQRNKAVTNDVCHQRVGGVWVTHEGLNTNQEFAYAKRWRPTALQTTLDSDISTSIARGSPDLRRTVEEIQTNAPSLIDVGVVDRRHKPHLRRLEWVAGQRSGRPL